MMNFKAKQFISIILFLFIGNLLLAQNLEIEYDAVTDKVTYFRKGKQVKTPKVKQNRNLLVRIKNFNNFLSEAKVTATAKEEVSPSNSSGSFNIMGLVSNLGDASNSAFQEDINRINESTSNALGFTPPSVIEIPASGVEEVWEEPETDFGFGDTEQEEAQPVITEGAKQFKAFNNRYQQIMEQVKIAEKEVRLSTDKVVGHLNTLLLTNITAEQLQKLKLNPVITNEVRQTVANELFQELLQKETAAISLKDALVFANTFESKTKIDRNKLRDERKNLSYELEKLEVLQSRINDLNTGDNASFKSLKKNIDRNVKSSAVLLNTSDLQDSNSKDILDLISGFNFPQKITQLYLNYQELKLNAYEYTFISTASGDFMEVTISIFTKQDSAGTEVSKLIKERKLIVPVVGGVKVNSSVGVGFTNYFKKQETYYNRNSLIVANDGDNFAPVITTLLHFYPQTASSVTVGGNFGVGFPILGENKSLNFFLGTSLLMGKTQRFVLNLGFMGGQTQRLDRGLQVGDDFGSEGEIIPVKNKYEFGYFLSGTFNL